MANRLFRPVQFALEPDVVTLSCRIVFGAAGAATLTVLNSKGFCNVAQFTKSFTATGTSTASLTAVSDFTNLYLGMALSGTNVAANSTITAMNGGAGTMTSSQATSGAIGTVTATGGYILTLGSQNPTRLDTYTKLMGFSHAWDMAAAQGSATTLALAPAAPTVFMTQDNVKNASLASIVLMTGRLTDAAGTPFNVVNPASGEVLKLVLTLSRSSAI